MACGRGKERLRYENEKKTAVDMTSKAARVEILIDLS